MPLDSETLRAGKCPVHCEPFLDVIRVPVFLFFFFFKH